MTPKTITFLSVFLASGAAFTYGLGTTGVYDENVVQPNQVDFDAPGSNLSSTQLAADIAAAYDDDFGAVIDASALRGSRSYDYGVSNAKELRFNLVAGDHWGITSPQPTSDLQSLSGSSVFAISPENGDPFHSYAFEVLDGEPNEQVVEFGVTVVSTNITNYGEVTISGLLASGGSITASRTIAEAGGLGDTFFGFAAPANDYLTGIELDYSGNVLWFDDLGFVTSVIPEPTTQLLSSVLVVGMACCRPQRFR